VSDRDLRILGYHDARVAHLPVANLYLGSGVAPLPGMLLRGITVGLGTDNANCNDSVSMFKEMTVASLIHKGIHHDAAVITARQVLRMASIDAARAIGENSRIGSIEQGKHADIILLDLQNTQLTPLHDISSALVNQANGSEVDTVLVDGQPLVTNGKLTFMSESEEAELRDEAQHRSSELLNTL